MSGEHTGRMSDKGFSLVPRSRRQDREWIVEVSSNGTVPRNRISNSVSTEVVLFYEAPVHFYAIQLAPDF